MKRIKLMAATVAAALMMSAAGAARAEPLNVARVPSGAKWVAHVDINAAVNSQYGQLATADMQSLGLETKLEALKSLLGLDPLKDFDSVTAFGKTLGGTLGEKEGALGDKEGTLVVQMGPSTGKLQDLAKLAKEYQQGEYKQYVIHSWIDEAKGRRQMREAAGQRVYCGVMPVAKAEKTLLVFSADEAMVKSEIDLLSAGGSKGLTLATQPGAGSIVYVSVADLTELAANQAERPAWANLITKLTCDIGEVNGKAYLSLSVGTSDAQQAANFQQMAMGLLAMVKMDEDPAKKPLVDLANQINIAVNDKTVSVRVEYPSKQLYELVKQLKTEHEQKAAQREGSAAEPAPVQ